MSICVISGKVSNNSAKALALALGAVYCNPFENDKRDFREFDVVFNYGANRNIKANKLFNKASSVVKCIDKHTTLYHLARSGVPTVEFASQKEDVLKDWQTIVVRQNRKSHAGKSLDYVEQGQPLPDAEFYTRYFEHKFELRLVVFQGRVVGRYIKEVDGETCNLMPVQAKGFEAIDAACIRAADVLGIDYVGFDVLANSEKDFRILEANSGPILTDEVADAIKESINV